VPHDGFRPPIQGVLLDGARDRFLPVEYPIHKSANIHGVQPITE
jgi:hypothetical protein